ncbi:MAG: hypothetical protein AB1801_07975, partial [Chloroflexota bacterium]
VEETAAPPLVTEEEEEAPAWLQELPAASAEEAEVPPLVAAEEAALPDWLRELPPLEETAAPPLVTEEEEESPAWLQELPAAPLEESPAPAVIEPEGEEFPDWLSALPPAAEAGQPAPLSETMDHVLPPDEAPDTPTWWAELEEAPADTPPLVSDWLTEVSAAPVAETEVSAEEFEPPDWLAGLRQAPAEEEEGEAPEWMAAPEPAAAEELEIPDWLSALRQAPPVEREEEISDRPAETAVEETAQTPPWLAGITDMPAAEEELAPPAAAVPAWLSESSEATIEQTAPPLAATEEDIELPAWLADLPPAPPAAAPVLPTADEAAETPDWLIETTSAPVSEEETPPWLRDTFEMAVEETVEAGPAEETVEIPDWLARLPEMPPEIAEAPVAQEAEQAPAWLAELGTEEELVLPDWLSETPPGLVKPAPESPGAGEVAPAEAEAEALLAGEDEPAVPDWLLEIEGADTLIDQPPIEKKEPPPDQDKGDEPDEGEPPPFSPGPDSPPPPAGGQAQKTDPAKTDSPAGASKSWWRALPKNAADLDEDDGKIAESTGVLTDLSGILPAQKIGPGAALTELGPVPFEGQKEAVLAAAREFQAIATAAPQPATLPAPLSRGDQLVKGVLRSGLYLLFMLLIALPLLPGLQKVIDPATDRRAPWTEPDGSLSEVLDRQRRELISSELGIIDVQQPGSVALVSFDYSPATQGELRPLAEAVLGRLRGQGMRLILVSLQPEGAALAQQTIDSILKADNEAYGTRLVNLGYLPGQVTAIRELAGGRLFATLSDYQNGAPFSQMQPNGWDDVQNMEQVAVVVNLTDNPTTARWWVEQMEAAVVPAGSERFLLAVTSATADPFLRPYRDSQQLDGLISGINGAAAIEAARKRFDSARQMLDSQSIAHFLIIVLIAAGTVVGWMPSAAHEAGSGQSQPAGPPGSANESTTPQLA